MTTFKAILIIFFFIFTSHVRSPNAHYSYEDLSENVSELVRFYSVSMSNPESISVCHRTIGTILLQPRSSKAVTQISAETADCVDEFGFTPLFFALPSNNYQLIKKILSFNPDLTRLIGPFQRPYIVNVNSDHSPASETDDSITTEVLSTLLKDNCDAIHVRLAEGISFRDEMLLRPWSSSKMLTIVDRICPGYIQFIDLVDPIRVIHEIKSRSSHSHKLHEICNSAITAYKEDARYSRTLTEIIFYALRLIISR